MITSPNTLFMTRITSFGIKRTYVQAGFSHDDEVENGKEETLNKIQEDANSTDPPKKKRKRNRKSKATVDKGNRDDINSAETEQCDNQEPALAAREETKKKGLRASKKKDLKKEREARRKACSENRRLKRIKDKRANTTCFVCREKGHTARECRTEEEAGSLNVVGICYRCGSRRHNLSRCKKPVDPLNPLPFASCFVCHKKGHLVSTCPDNKEKGVYPDGGSCKLCGETSHLAKDCGLRKRDTTKTALVLGTGKDAGADEDDFHTLNRNKRDVDREEQLSEKRKKKMDVKVGVHLGLVKPFAAGTKGAKATSKVVKF